MAGGRARRSHDAGRRTTSLTASRPERQECEEAPPSLPICGEGAGIVDPVEMFQGDILVSTSTVGQKNPTATKNNAVGSLAQVIYI